jgi:hypothetical protein
MVVHLGIQSPLGESLLHLVEQAFLAKADWASAPASS